MPGVMANNDNGNVGAMAAQRPQRDPSPELRQRGCWGKFWCLGSRKRGMRIVPARQEGSGPASNAWASNGASSSTAANQFVGLSPSLLAPPSSPASFANSGNPSTVQSPAGFTVSLCVPAANACSPAFDSTATMFTIGPYAHETTLVTPPAFSAFTTAPSTAPFTPPPELAHLTTPSSPDVPFAQLLTSLKNKGCCAVPGPAPPYSASPFASPDYISRSDMHQLYPESPLTSLISPASGISESGPPSPLPELEFPAAITAAAAAAKSSSRSFRMTSFSTSEPRRQGHETPQSIDSNNHSRELEPIRSLGSNNHSRELEPIKSLYSNNHSRELEPIKVLSPPREYLERCTRIVDSGGENETCTSTSTFLGRQEEQQQQQQKQHHYRNYSLQDNEAVIGIDERDLEELRPAESESTTDQPESVQQEASDLLDKSSSSSHRYEDIGGEEAARRDADDASTCSSYHGLEQEQQEQQQDVKTDDVSRSNETGNCEGEVRDLILRNAGSPRYSGIILKVLVTPDEHVKVNMTPRNGCANGYVHCKPQRNGEAVSSEDLDNMSVDCMELNLADNTIR